MGSSGKSGGPGSGLLRVYGYLHATIHSALDILVLTQYIFKWAWGTASLIAEEKATLGTPGIEDVFLRLPQISVLEKE